MFKNVFAIVMLAAVSAEAAAQPIGRLFFSPEQRKELDRARENGGDAFEAREIQEAQTIMVTGLVRSSGGKNTAWISRPSAEKSLALHTARSADGRGGANALALDLSSGKSVTLKAGQAYDLTSGRISEPYETPPDPTVETNRTGAREK